MELFVPNIIIPRLGRYFQDLTRFPGALYVGHIVDHYN
nr:MAG TPA: hypothetical protein [Caudoviricetes sp.]